MTHCSCVRYDARCTDMVETLQGNTCEESDVRTDWKKTAWMTVMLVRLHFWL